MGLIARALEMRGIATTVPSWNLGYILKTQPPRAVSTHLQRGATLGHPNDPDQQRRVLTAALALLNQDAPLAPLRLEEA